MTGAGNYNSSVSLAAQEDKTKVIYHKYYKHLAYVLAHENGFGVQ